MDNFYFFKYFKRIKEGEIMLKKKKINNYERESL